MSIARVVHHIRFRRTYEKVFLGTVLYFQETHYQDRSGTVVLPHPRHQVFSSEEYEDRLQRVQGFSNRRGETSVKYIILIALFALAMAGCTQKVKQSPSNPAIWCEWGRKVFPHGKNRTVTIGDKTYSCE